MRQPDGSIKKIPFPEYIANVAPKKVVVSLVIPAYNEEERLPKMLDETIDVPNLYVLS